MRRRGVAPRASSASVTGCNSCRTFIFMQAFTMSLVGLPSNEHACPIVRAAHEWLKGCTYDGVSVSRIGSVNQHFNSSFVIAHLLSPMVMPGRYCPGWYGIKLCERQLSGLPQASRLAKFTSRCCVNSALSVSVSGALPGLPPSSSMLLTM